MSAAPTTPTSILLVEDDAPVAAAIVDVLEAAGHQVEHVDTGAAARRALSGSHPDLIILDLMLPDTDGFELCSELRRAAPDVPIIMCSAAARPQDRVRGLRVGADDFIGKPFNLDEFEARIDAVLRRAASPDPQAAPTSGDVPPIVVSRRRAMDLLKQLLHLSARHRQPFSVAILAVQPAEQSTGRAGQRPGDEILHHFGRRLTEWFRREDVVARWTGDTLLVGMYAATAAVAARRLNTLLDLAPGEADGGATGELRGTTVSAGIAEHGRDGADLPALLGVCEERLARARAVGATSLLAV